MLDQDKIEILQGIVHELQSLAECEARFLDIFAREEEAVVAHDISALEKIGAEKQALLGCLEAGIQYASQRCHELDPGKPAPKSFTQMKACIEGLVDDSTGTQAARPLAALSQGILAKLDALIESYSDIKPQIEKNRFIIARLLHHHQQSYRFWSELKKENSSNYNAKGAKNQQARISQVFAKA